MIKHDPRWLDMLTRYSADLPAFVAEVCGIPCDWSVHRAYQDLSRPGARVSIAGNLDKLDRPGAISPLAPVALWHLLCRPMSTTMVVLPSTHNARRKEQYKALVAQVAKGRYGWVVDYLVWRGFDLSVRDHRFWMVTLRAPYDPTALCGQSSPALMWIFEDAHAQKTDNFNVAGASCTHYANSMAMLLDSRATASFASDVHAGIGRWVGWRAHTFQPVQTPTERPLLALLQ